MERRRNTVNDHFDGFSVIGEGPTTVAVLRAKESGVQLPTVARAAQADIDDQLNQHGAVLFRGFEVTSPETFAEVGAHLGNGLYGGNHEHVPVSPDGLVQVPVPYAADRTLLWHNENSFNDRWPLRLLFCCTRPADSGGQTPLVNGREVLKRLGRSADRFLEHGVSYERIYGPGIGLDWRTVFGTDDRAAIERACTAERMRFEWLSDDRLRTRAVRPAVVHHPRTRAESWFAQLLHWHPACLDGDTREALLEIYGPAELPRNCHYGDGSPIEDELIDDLRNLHSEVELAFDWERGDVLLVDNVLCAHGRRPYEGTRTLLVALGDMQRFGGVGEPTTAGDVARG